MADASNYAGLPWEYVRRMSLLSIDDKILPVVPDERYYKLLERDDNKREKTWASNLVVLRDDTHIYTLQESVDVLKQQVRKTFHEIELSTGHSITEFIIGKTIAKERGNIGFELGNFSTWNNEEGVKKRWQVTYSINGFDGLVVLCGITQDIVPENVRRSLESVIKRNEEKDDIMKCKDNVQQLYALILEQRLIQYYMAEQCDIRLGNNSLSPGKVATQPYAGVVYVAYKLSYERQMPVCGIM